MITKEGILRNLAQYKPQQQKQFTGANVKYALFMNFEEKIFIALTLFLCFFFSAGNLDAKTNGWQPLP